MDQMSAAALPGQVLLDVDADDRAAVLRCIAESTARAHGLEAAPIERALLRREQASSTAPGHRFALPHARIEGLREPLTVFLRTRHGLAFGAPDGRPVRDFFAILVPCDGANRAHLDLLAAVVHRFADAGFRARLDAASTPRAVLEAFRASGEAPG